MSDDFESHISIKGTEDGVRLEMTDPPIELEAQDVATGLRALADRVEDFGHGLWQILLDVTAEMSDD